MAVSPGLSGDLVKQLDDIAEKTGHTRNKTVQLCLEFAIESIKQKNKAVILWKHLREDFNSPTRMFVRYLI